MKKALISSIEPVINFDGTTGYRVAEVKSKTFEVSPALFWVDCDDACVADIWYYDTAQKTCLVKPVEPQPKPEPQPVNG
jgi:hypothetical protein